MSTIIKESDKKVKTDRLGNLSVGEFFKVYIPDSSDDKSKDDLYIKIQSATHLSNSFCINKGYIFSFAPELKIIPFNTEIIITSIPIS